MANIITDAWFWATTGKTASEIEAETAAADQWNAARDADLIARGVWDQRAIQASSENRARETYAENMGGQVAQAAAEGAQEGLATMADGVRNTVNAVGGGILSTVWRAVPWWVWLAGAGYLAFRLGLLAPALRALKIKLP